MTSRERVLKTICKDIPDRPSLFATVTPQVAEKLSAHLGLEYEEPLDSLLSTRISHMGLLSSMGNDCVGIAACAPTDRPTITHPDGIIENEWGMKFISAGPYNEFHEFPLENTKSAADIRAYILWAGVDFGSQTGMLIDPETWRKFFKPRIKIMFDAVKSLKS